MRFLLVISEISGVIFRSLFSSNLKIYDSGLDDNHTDLRPALCAFIEPSERISWSKFLMCDSF